MNVRKTLFSNTKAALANLSLFQLIDLQRGQFENPKGAYGTIYTAALIEIARIPWEDMTNRRKEGQATLSVYLYTKEGFADQLAGTPDPDYGLAEIELQDQIIHALEGMLGSCFTAFRLSSEQRMPAPHFGLMAYRLDFQSRVYMDLNAYTLQKLTLNPDLCSSLKTN